MSVTGMSGTRTRSTADVRAACRALRAEKAQVLRWRRLLRARLDLAVAAYAPPEDLGALTWDLLPGANLALPLPEVLADAVVVPAPTDQVALMERLRMLDRLLTTYGIEIDAALDASTDQAARHLVDAASTPAEATDAR